MSYPSPVLLPDQRNGLIEMKRRERGARGEKLAGEFLKRKGYRLRETNFRCREGEIDIVAEHGDYLVFVEVRTKKSTQFGTPEESITAAKREKLIEVAQVYLQTHEDIPPFWRIDVVAVELAQNEKPSRIELIENAIN